MVKEPLTKYKKACEEFRSHEMTQYHRFSMEKAVQFSQSMESKTNKSVAVILDSKKRTLIETNKQRLRPITKTVLFCARNNLPLRGHRDDGFRDLPVEDVESGKHGVFNSLLTFRLDAGDVDLKQHLNTCGKNSTMISKTIQNDIIECIGEKLRSDIVKDVKQAKFYAILCDETTDISTKEQMTVSIRYINPETCEVKEDFVGFVELKSTTGSSIKAAIDEELNSLGLSYEFLCGQGYDGGSNMAGKFNGTQALILAQQPLAIYCHCFSHSLNLCISKSCELPAVRNMFGIVSKASVFFSISAKRSNALKSTIAKSNLNETKKTKLKAMCPTRWVERHDSLLTFKELYEHVMNLLKDMASSNEFDEETSTKAYMFYASLTRSDFIVALEVTAYCLSITHRLSERLQSPDQDLSSALTLVREVLDIFKDLRRNAELEFESLFENSLKIADNIGVDISAPRVCKKQTTRENIPANNAEEYFRRTVFLPLVDHFITELETRFSREFDGILPLEGLIPSQLMQYENKEILKASDKYEKFLQGTQMQLKAELMLWRKRWEDRTLKPETAVDALRECDANLFPNVATLLQIFGTVPVTTSSAERTFSSLRRLKTYLRSTMGQCRLNGLALANIHKNRNIDPDAVISIFSTKKSRRLTLENWAKDDD